jgi:hypothetical protein
MALIGLACRAVKARPIDGAQMRRSNVALNARVARPRSGRSRLSAARASV